MLTRYLTVLYLALSWSTATLADKAVKRSKSSISKRIKKKRPSKKSSVKDSKVEIKSLGGSTDGGDDVSYSLGLQFDGGMLFSQTGTDQEVDKRGYSAGLGALLSVQRSGIIFDLGLSWVSSSLSVTDEFEAQRIIEERLANGEEVSEELKAQEVDTSFGVLEAGASIRGGPLQFGPTAMITFGADTDFGASEESSTPNLFLGFKILAQNEFDDRSVFSRIGLKLYTDVSISDRQVYFVSAHVAVGMPLAKPETVVEKQVEYRTKTKIQKEVKIVRKVRDQFFIDAGIVNFVTGKSNLPPSVSNYLRALGQYLKRHPKKWQKIMIVSHTDKRGSAAINRRLSKKRANSVKSALQSGGLSSHKFTVKSKASTDPVEGGSDAVSLARNRRVEISIVGGAEIPSLKQQVLKLQQRYRMPATCRGAACK